MPFLRFSRDKRGYEHTYLVQAHEPAWQAGSSPRPLLVSDAARRSGRAAPFDDEVRRTLEAQNPGVTFDWEALVVDADFPPQEPEHWRERRRAEQAAKQARRGEEGSEAAETAEAPEEPSEVREPPPADGSLELSLEPATSDDRQLKASTSSEPLSRLKRRSP